MSGKAGRASVADASLVVSHVLPADKDLTIVSDPIDLGELTGISSHNELAELLLSAPALAVGQLPNAAVITHTIQAAAATSFASPRTLGVLTQTGAGGAGDVAATLRAKLPSDCPRYVRVSSSTDHTCANCAAARVGLALLF